MSCKVGINGAKNLFQNCSSDLFSCHISESLEKKYRATYAAQFKIQSHGFLKSCQKSWKKFPAGFSSSGFFLYGTNGPQCAYSHSTPNVKIREAETIKRRCRRVLLLTAVHQRRTKGSHLDGSSSLHSLINSLLQMTT